MRRTVLQAVVTGLVLALVAAAIGARAGHGFFTLPSARGTGAWTFSRAAGVSAYLALTLDVLFGLLVSTGAADRWIARARSVEVHRFLSLAALLLTAGHAGALLFDGYVRFDALDVLLPFVARYRTGAVALGVLAAYVALVVHASFALRARIGQRAWRALHYLAFAGFAGATAHGALAGTDHALPWMRAMYLASAGLVLWLTLFRVMLAVSPGRGARSPQALRR